jgi:hypothetical protein
MTLDSLQHILRSAAALADDRCFVVLGSASLLASFPQLGDPDAPLSSTFDADLCPQPFDELTGTMLHEALGEDRAYHRRQGYHADILRETIFETLPDGWRERLVPVPGCPSATALDPHDLAAVKLLVARPKDLALLRHLFFSSLLDPAVVAQRIGSLPIPSEAKPRVHSNLRMLAG